MKTSRGVLLKVFSHSLAASSGRSDADQGVAVADGGGNEGAIALQQGGELLRALLRVVDRQGRLVAQLQQSLLLRRQIAVRQGLDVRLLYVRGFLPLAGLAVQSAQADQRAGGARVLDANRLQHADGFVRLAAAAQCLAERIAKVGVVGVVRDRGLEDLAGSGVLAGVHVGRRQRQGRRAVVRLPAPRFPQ